MELVTKLETLSKEFDVIQKVGDETMAKMTPEQRKHFNIKNPGFFSILGWDNRIDEDGNIIYDA
jgi:hypothetical protein